MENLSIYNQLKEVPKEVKKQITGGRLKGMTDIKPQWRIEKLTEVFGACGFGWYYEVTKVNYIAGALNEMICTVNINLFVKMDEEWSKPIPGCGGSMFVTAEKLGLHTSDEAEKMATTDALSVAMKMLGMGADVYMGYSDSKYVDPTNHEQEPKIATPVKKEPETWLNIYEDKAKTKITEDFIKCHQAIHDGTGKYTIASIRKRFKVSKEAETALNNKTFLN